MKTIVMKSDKTVATHESHSCHLSRVTRFTRAFTIVELLVVISIIAILAGLLLPVLAAAKKQGLKTQARLQISQIATAIQQYDSAYSRFPVSRPVQTVAGTNDFTYGGSLFTANIPPLPPGYSIYTTNNSEVIAILMDITNYPPNTGLPIAGLPTANANHQKNPQQTPFLSAKMGDANNTNGVVGPDLVYRDPWGNPYVISMDLNYDGQCEDAFYGLQKVSGGGLNGLILQPDGNYAAHSEVMVWSAGPDGEIDPNSAATIGANKDNILSWQ
ncbi:MAG: type II secretion system protein [Limisphaerales bacterium]